MNGKVEVKGLAEFSRALKKLDADAPKGVRLALNESADFLISATKPKIPSRTGAARASLKAKSTRTLVRISAGGRRAPYYPWLDFGGRTGRRRSVSREFIKEGRYLYPTLRVERQRFQDILQDSLVKVAEGAGMEVD